jgi:3-methyladenine DNA glycosylase/8-oxoguanine DNA glycosylase
MPSSMTLTTPPDYRLSRDVCSYGYFLLAPNHWDVKRRVLVRPLDLPGGIATLTIGQNPGRGSPVRAVADRALSRPDRAAAERMIARMLRLDDTQVGAFHKIDPRWKRSGRGRLFRSPTFFEDLIKTVTSCNVAWPSTIRMNERLCAVFNRAFPRATQIARKRPATLRARCGVGYRDARIVELAKMVASGAIDAEWFEDPATSDDAVHEALLDLPGIGPYAAANIMQLLGRYARLPVDTETVRHAKTVLGMTGSARQIERAVHAHYEPFGAHKFRSYWFEVWAWYEEKRGKAWTWDRETTGKTFTAAQF